MECRLTLLVLIGQLSESAPDVNDVAVTLSQAVRKGGLDSQLIELVMVRASQINGCVFCLQTTSWQRKG